jgi:glycosyltransferase 2 family protein
MGNRVKFLMRLLGIGVFVYILFHVDIALVASVLKRVEFGPLIPAFFLLFPLYGIKAYRWKGILRVQQVSYSLRNAILAYLSANFIAFATPGRIGEAAKALYVKQDTGIGLFRALPSVILDRFFDVYVLTIVASVGLIRLEALSRWGAWKYAFLGVIVLAPLLFLSISVRGFFLGRMTKIRFLRAWGGKTQGFFVELNRFRASDLLIPLLQTIGAYALLFLMSDMIARAAGIRETFLTISFFVSMANVLSFLPISIAGLGTRDACFIFLFSTIGRLKEEALAFSLLFFLVFFLGGGLIGFLAYCLKPIHFPLSRLFTRGDLREESKPRPPSIDSLPPA